MQDYSLDNSAEKIHDSKTKEYFQEVIKSYYSGSYRSAIVMLYSIVIADLVYKLEDLKDLYSDKAAKEILEEIAQLQETNPNSPDWESKLIELVRKRTSLLEAADHLNITFLQKHRHLCAHPVIKQDYELYNPNKETARAHIRNSLEGVLTKPPLLSRTIFKDFVNDLVKIKERISDDAELERYLESRYFKNLSEKIELSLFKSLWKLTLKLDNQECNENRDINLRALLILLKRNAKACIEAVQKENKFYSDIDENFTDTLIIVLNLFPDVFNKLSEGTRILIEKRIDDHADYDAASLFRSTTISKHVDKILDIDSDWEPDYAFPIVKIATISYIAKLILMQGDKAEAHRLLIKMFSQSRNYNQADSRFNWFIHPFLESFNKEELTDIVKATENNSQISGRREAHHTSRFIGDHIDDVFDGEFDFDSFPTFKHLANR